MQIHNVKTLPVVLAVRAVRRPVTVVEASSPRIRWTSSASWQRCRSRSTRRVLQVRRPQRQARGRGWDPPPRQRLHTGPRRRRYSHRRHTWTAEDTSPGCCWRRSATPCRRMEDGRPRAFLTRSTCRRCNNRRTQHTAQTDCTAAASASVNVTNERRSSPFWLGFADVQPNTWTC